MKTHTKATANQITKLLCEVWPGEKVCANQDNTIYHIFTQDFDRLCVLCDVLHEILDIEDLTIRHHTKGTVFLSPHVVMIISDLTEADTMVIDDLSKGQIQELVSKYKLVRDLEEHPVKVFFKKVYGFFFN